MSKREQRGMIAGMILGDGSLQKREMYKNPVIRINHSIKQRQYLLWKVSLLQALFHYPLESSIRYKDITVRGNEYKVCMFNSRVSSKLKTIYRIAYKNGKKVISQELLELLTPLGLALWYMDDGCCNIGNRTVSLSTYCTLDEALTCQRYFINTWDIHWKLMKHKSGYSIGRGYQTDDMAKFKKIIEPYIIDSMKYKIDAIARTMPKGMMI